jgi:hypothetical protein
MHTLKPGDFGVDTNPRTRRGGVKLHLHSATDANCPQSSRGHGPCQSFKSSFALPWNAGGHRPSQPVPIHAALGTKRRVRVFGRRHPASRRGVPAVDGRRRGPPGGTPFTPGRASRHTNHFLCLAHLGDLRLKGVRGWRASACPEGASLSSLPRWLAVRPTHQRPVATVAAPPRALRCPRCHGTDTRPSRRRRGDWPPALLGLRPCRRRECGTRFWRWAPRP